MQRLAVILNPKARRGKVPTSAASVRHALGDTGTVHVTEDLADLSRVSRELIRRKTKVVAISGGDGTLNWVINSALAVTQDASRLPIFVPTNGGTIDFVARRAGIQGNVISITSELATLARRDRLPQTQWLDSLLLSGKMMSAQDRPEGFRRIGFALAAGGIGQRFFSKYYEQEQLGARGIVTVVSRAVLSYLAENMPVKVPAPWTTYSREIFRPTPAQVWIDDQQLDCSSHGAIHAGAFDISLGGVFRVFPLAKQSGKIHFQAGGIVPKEMIRALPALARGRKIPSPHLVERSGTRMRIKATSTELLAPILDGESIRDVIDMTVELGPRIRIGQIQA